MNTIIINECEDIKIPQEYTYSLKDNNVKDCTGCWTCWWKTPGKCIYNDLNEFYNQYINADKAVFLSKVKKGFVSGNIKTLFDRMIPLFLPYVTYKTGESMHVPRYEKYPDIEFFYDGEFETSSEEQILIDYINRVFYQFYSKKITIKPISEFGGVIG